VRRLCAWLVVLAFALGGLCQASMAAGATDHCAAQCTTHGHADHDGAGHAGTIPAKAHKSCCPDGCLPGSLVPSGLREYPLVWRLAELAPMPPPDRPGLTPSCPLRPPNRPMST
jgi:hypothetical protein